MIYTEYYDKKMQEEIDVINEGLDVPASQAYTTAFIDGYKLAAYHWHGVGLTEGWNDHIKKLKQLMEELGGGDEC